MNKQTLDFEKPIVELEQKLGELLRQSEERKIDLRSEIESMQRKIEATRERVYGSLTAWQRVQIARHIARPFFLDYVRMACTDFVELKGDRLFGDDASMPGGLATIGGIRCVVIGQQKGRDMKENLLRNFGSPHPEGYRKALRLMRMAEKFGFPFVAFIDTPGAYPGIGAEERHIAEAIAVNIRDMMTLRTPIISIVIGEGGSGGALGIGVADRVLMLENAYYSVISPEGCAAILWKHRKHAPEAAEALKLCAPDLVKMGLVDGVIPEPAGGAHCNPEQAADNIRATIEKELQILSKTPIEKLLTSRYEKFRRMGVFEE
ncbi:MAG: acetyl-CoA carboxylase carboxyl transferase subunit alpha [Spartobacteria bacterium AMD-G5]|nr:MAG: acetyl-CoA carboxylase carboxyl transferase subunit alpha [Spartobacteria bacterium AMD-G5]